jgi:maltooligosyltrehalose trehalohydrolase
VRRRLDYLVDLGITAVELMPLSDFAGTRNWGYDGVMPFAPDAAYGTPDDLKRLIDEAHGRGLMIFLDVVYNHFGPVGNYLHQYAESFFEPEEHTPWGAAINYKVRAVRDFAIHNVLYWLEEFRFDGLRFDAVDRIIDRGEEHILKEIAATVRRTIPAGRHVHLVLENDKNHAHLVERDAGGRPMYYDAQWNDDIHHVYHYLLTGEAGGYYADYATDAHERLGRALSSGYVYQGDVSEYRNGAVRGEPSAHLPPTAFVGFIQNHDQVGNRAFGERIAGLAEHEAVKAMQAVLLLAPQIPLLFMGEEWGATQPFCFFTDFHDELADAVREGRRREFKRFPEFASEAARAHIPDPNAFSTFAASRLDWSVPEQPEHRAWLDLVRRLIRIRAQAIVPRLAGVRGNAGEATILSDSALRVAWTLGDGSTLEVIANLADQTSAVALAGEVEGDVLFANHPDLRSELSAGRLPPWSVLWLLNQRAR